jgi:hypothetical protein
VEDERAIALGHHHIYARATPSILPDSPKP